MKLVLATAIACLALLAFLAPPATACPIPAPPCSGGCAFYDPCGVTPVVPAAQCQANFAIGVGSYLGSATVAWGGAAANAAVRTVNNVVFGTPC
jgi:hypothetical protein